MTNINRHIVIDARPIGSSTGRYLRGLVENLAKLDKDNHYTVLVWPSFDKESLPLPNNFKYKDADYPVTGSIKEQSGLVRLLGELKPDLVHFGLPQQPVFYRGKVITSILDLTTTRFRNSLKNPVIFGVKQQAYKWLIKRVAKKSAHIITISNFVKNDIAEFTHIPKDKITVTYNAADPICEPPEGVPGLTGKKFIMYVGRPLPHKNLGRLIDSFAIIQKSHPKLWLVLAGKKDVLYERYEKNIKKRGIKNILFTGFVSEGQLRWLYENTAAYVFPSLSEGFGLPGLEAMAAGAPVVSSNATCLPEIYGQAAHYFNPEDIQDMVAKIDQVLASENLRQDLIKKGHTQIKKYSWTKMAAQTLEVYNQALNK